MTGIEATEILITDLEDARQILAACLTLLTAQDVAKAQLSFSRIRESALTQEVTRVKERLDGIFGDFLLVRYENEEEDSNEEEDDPNEELAAEPLGAFRAPSQQGRRLDGIDGVDDDAG